MLSHHRHFKQSLRYALQGISVAIKHEKNMRIHLFAAGVTTTLGFIFKLSRFEWLFLTLAITLVLFAELMNTALEANVDLVTKEIKPEAKIAKDVAAGAVLITSLHALIVAGVIFLPRLIS